MAELMEDRAMMEEFGIEIVESRWRSGWHEMKDGKKIRIKEMSNSHIENTIKLFAMLDTSPLERELKRRK